MLRCPELSKLPKAPRYKSINFRRQTPGSVVSLFGNAKPSVLDPTHPAAFLPKSKFPNFRGDGLGINAHPFAVLAPSEHFWDHPFMRPIDSWTERINRFNAANADKGLDEKLAPMEPMILNNTRNNRIPMSFLNATSKKRTSAKKHIRLQIVKRLKTAINLIVIRGANTVEVEGKKKLVMVEEEAKTMADKWILRGWTYVFYPTLEIYRMPYHDLIPLLRTGLQQIWTSGSYMEQLWESQVSQRTWGSKRLLRSSRRTVHPDDHTRSHIHERRHLPPHINPRTSSDLSPQTIKHFDGKLPRTSLPTTAGRGGPKKSFGLRDDAVSSAEVDTIDEQLPRASFKTSAKRGTPKKSFGLRDNAVDSAETSSMCEGSSPYRPVSQDPIDEAFESFDVLKDVLQKNSTNEMNKSIKGSQVGTPPSFSLLDGSRETFELRDSLRKKDSNSSGAPPVHVELEADRMSDNATGKDRPRGRTRPIARLPRLVPRSHSTAEESTYDSRSDMSMAMERAFDTVLARPAVVQGVKQLTTSDDAKQTTFDPFPDFDNERELLSHPRFDPSPDVDLKETKKSPSSPAETPEHLSYKTTLGDRLYQAPPIVPADIARSRRKHWGRR